MCLISSKYENSNNDILVWYQKNSNEPVENLIIGHKTNDTFSYNIMKINQRNINLECYKGLYKVYSI